MGLLDALKKEVLQPAVEIPQNQGESNPVKEDTGIKELSEVENSQAETVQPRQVQNLVVPHKCLACEDGLVKTGAGELVKCTNCGGTTKLEIGHGTYKSGTVLILKDKGTFIVNDYGELIPQIQE